MFYNFKIYLAVCFLAWKDWGEAASISMGQVASQLYSFRWVTLGKTNGKKAWYDYADHGANWRTLLPNDQKNVNKIKWKSYSLFFSWKLNQGTLWNFANTVHSANAKQDCRRCQRALWKNVLLTHAWMKHGCLKKVYLGILIH